MTHQQALAQEIAQASKSQPYTSHIPNEHSTFHTELPVLNSSTTPPQEQLLSGIADPGVTIKESFGISHSDQRSQPSSLNVSKSNDDGYNWQKYGQKHVKGSEFLISITNARILVVLSGKRSNTRLMAR